MNKSGARCCLLGCTMDNLAEVHDKRVIALLLITHLFAGEKAGRKLRLRYDTRVWV